MPKTDIEFEDGAVCIDASMIGRALGLDAARVQTLMREGEITGLCERGVDEDAGRYRLTFFHKGRRLRFIVDETGSVIRRSLIDFGERPLPASMRRGTPKTRN